MDQKQHSLPYPDVSNLWVTSWTQPPLQTSINSTDALFQPREQLKHALSQTFQWCGAHLILTTQGKIMLGIHHSGPQIIPSPLLTISPQDYRKTFASLAEGVPQKGRDWDKKTSSSLWLSAPFYLQAPRLSWGSGTKCIHLFIRLKWASWSVAGTDVDHVLYFVLRIWSLNTLSVVSGKNESINYVYNEI